MPVHVSGGEPVCDKSGITFGVLTLGGITGYARVTCVYFGVACAC